MNVYLNQRTHRRERQGMPVMYARLSDGEFFKTSMYDHSLDGICFISHHPYLPRTMLAIKTGKDDTPLTAEVKWSRPMFSISRDAAYRIGVQFTEPV